MIPLKARVSIDDYVGTVVKIHEIVVLGNKRTVYTVRWDGDPEFYPFQWRDEAGTKKRGNLEQELTLIS